ncbi:HPr family phosphocarrier protein [Bradyrhizobium sp. LHD-71]|uniref:HPr family phosphocarrier protein n=1 Tax=Bradyrhizobium sp. LHD-71 TaxID=3072141 RepID=UPI00280C908C|nr:HPr family phosphocarrier protein [Bradyrhizobium sp. LHD-71]MDQ8727298.1 HPr family phosphocarrier protein [Bradyrhizobium sp. LHD-71]
MSEAPDGGGRATDNAPSSGGTIVREIPITNKRGLHARASAKFVQMAERFKADITVTRNNETVGGNSIMGLMMLSAGPGSSVIVSATGPEAREAIEALTTLVTTKFGEDE